MLIPQIPCYGESIPCFAAEQGIASKALRLLREMTVGLAKTAKKGQKSANFPVLFAVLSESVALPWRITRYRDDAPRHRQTQQG
jgi:hypothetical protein